MNKKKKKVSKKTRKKLSKSAQIAWIKKKLKKLAFHDQKVK